MDAKLVIHPLSFLRGRRTFKATDMSLDKNSKVRGWGGGSVVMNTLWLRVVAALAEDIQAGKTHTHTNTSRQMTHTYTSKQNTQYNRQNTDRKIQTGKRHTHIQAK